MALLFCDSFDHYATANLVDKLWTNSGVQNGVTPQIATGGRRASGSFRLAVSSVGTIAAAYISRSVGTADPTFIIGFALSIPSALIGTGGLTILAIRDTATTQITLRVNPSMNLSVIRGTGAGTVLGTSSGSLSSGVFTYVELKVKIDPSAGTVDLRLNGASVLSLTAQNTRQTTNSSWNALAFGNIDSNSNNFASGATGNIDVDDLYVADGTGAAPWNTFLGDIRVDALYPAGAGSNTAWTPSAGANYAAVDETPPNADTDYTSTPNVGATDTFPHGPAPVPGATIYGVQHCLNAKKMDAGTCALAAAVKQGATVYVGPDLAPSTSYGYLLQVQQTNPATGAAWLEGDFNADEIGYRKTA